MSLHEGSWEQRKFYTIEIYDQEAEERMMLTDGHGESADLQSDGTTEPVPGEEGMCDHVFSPSQYQCDRVLFGASFPILLVSDVSWRGRIGEKLKL